MAASGEVDFAIATEAIGERDDLVMLPCYYWNRCVLVAKNHPLAAQKLVSLAQIAQYPVVTYVFGYTGRSQLDRTFAEAGQRPNIVLTAVDSDVIKTYVRQELGIGIVARMAHNETEDADLVALDAGHLFPDSMTKIGFRRGKFLRGYMYEFMELFAAHLTLQTVDAARHSKTREEVEKIFADVELPVY
jgi:LysR family cys regulon transcriptional activator